MCDTYRLWRHNQDSSFRALENHSVGFNYCDQFDLPCRCSVSQRGRLFAKFSLLKHPVHAEDQDYERQ